MRRVSETALTKVKVESDETFSVKGVDVEAMAVELTPAGFQDDYTYTSESQVCTDFVICKLGYPTS